MRGKTTTLGLKWLALALTLGALSAPAVQAKAATSVGGAATTSLRVDGRPTSGKASSHHLARNVRMEQSSASYFWVDVGITAGVLAGFFVLGLWGDVAIGGLIAGIGFLGVRAARMARKAYVRGCKAFAREAASDTPTPVRSQFQSLHRPS